ncbi:MAG: LUD domain-containing protein [Candidatus Pacebacteria bacterium]|nr:LUD domain-containing protein [Candidatus Paceibacterota bacterium]MBP9852219.1 LUD domain-containing protein [Candidatus Paceibacterota bacterium]
MNYTQLPSTETVTKTIEALKTRNIEGHSVATGADALALVKQLIPAGASVNNGSSTTLHQIGLVDYLKDSEANGWNNLHAASITETDPEKKSAAQHAAHFADFYLGSVHALTEDGELVIASASGSQLPSIVHTAKNIIFVVSTMKIMPNLEAALDRVRTHVVPLEDARMKSVNMGGTALAKIVLFEMEPAFTGRKIHVVFVNEALGF